MVVSVASRYDTIHLLRKVFVGTKVLKIILKYLKVKYTISIKVEQRNHQHQVSNMLPTPSFVFSLLLWFVVNDRK